MRTITFELTVKEYSYLLSVVGTLHITSPNLSAPMISALKKLTTALVEQATIDELLVLKNIQDSLYHALGEPSIERGMLMGGIEGLVEKAKEYHKKNDR